MPTDHTFMSFNKSSYGLVNKSFSYNSYKETYNSGSLTLHSNGAFIDPNPLNSLNLQFKDLYGNGLIDELIYPRSILNKIPKKK